MTPGIILAIDPGSSRSAWVSWDSFANRPLAMGIQDNVELLHELRLGLVVLSANVVVIEGITSYGKVVGKEVFDTLLWSGRFDEAASRPPFYGSSTGMDVVYLSRAAVKAFLSGSSAAKDLNIRAAMIERFGGKEVAIGRAAAPGPFFKVKEDLWAAIGVAVAYAAGAR